MFLAERAPALLTSTSPWICRSRDPRRWARWLVACALGTALVLSFLASTSVATASARGVTLKPLRVTEDGNLLVAGAVRARRGDVGVLYFARRCASTVRAARRGHYIIASGRFGRTGVERFRATVALGDVKPRAGRACYLLADSNGRTRRQASRGYRLR